MIESQEEEETSLTEETISQDETQQEVEAPQTEVIVPSAETEAIQTEATVESIEAGGVTEQNDSEDESAVPTEEKKEEEFVNDRADDNESESTEEIDEIVVKDVLAEEDTSGASEKTELTVTNNVSMFTVKSASLTKADGKTTLAMVMSSTSYSKVYVGTAEEAEKSGQTVELNASKTFMLPADSLLEKATVMSFYSSKKGSWYERQITVSAENKSLIVENVPEKPTVKEFDNSTTLENGEYTADAFDFSGGSGRAQLTLEKVIVENGKATAVMKASSTGMTHVYLGAKPSESDTPELYDPSADKCGTNVYSIVSQTVTIPVRINEDIPIAVRIIAMGSPRWVDYIYKITINGKDNPAEENFDNSTTLPDGEYKPDDYSWEGGNRKGNADLYESNREGW